MVRIVSPVERGRNLSKLSISGRTVPHFCPSVRVCFVDPAGCRQGQTGCNGCNISSAFCGFCTTNCLKLQIILLEIAFSSSGGCRFESYMAHEQFQGLDNFGLTLYFVPARWRRVLELCAQPIDRRPVPIGKGVTISGQGNDPPPLPGRSHRTFPSGLNAPGRCPSALRRFHSGRFQ